MIQKNDFIEIEYTGKTKDEDIVFDTTNVEVAKENGFPGITGPSIICVGQNQLIEGLEKNIIGKELNKEYDIILQPDDAFGKKSAKLVQLVPSSKFRENDIAPQPGLQVNIDGLTGIIKHVSGGRTLVDFNHPLAGKEIEYKFKILRKVEDDKEKLENFLKAVLGLKEIKAELKDGKAEVNLKKVIPKDIKKQIENKVIETIPSIKELNFIKEEKTNNKDPTTK